MAVVWFRRWGWLYRPASVVGWVVTLSAIAFCGDVFWTVDKHSHSVSDTLYGIFPYFACTFLLVNWLASRTSGDRQ